jgi:hypothetical protein
MKHDGYTVVGASENIKIRYCKNQERKKDDHSHTSARTRTPPLAARHVRVKRQSVAFD